MYDSKLQIYEQTLPGESALAFDAFQEFLDMGANENIWLVAEIVRRRKAQGRAWASCQEWATKFRWFDRAQAFKSKLISIKLRAQHQLLLDQEIDWMQEKEEQRRINLNIGKMGQMVVLNEIRYALLEQERYEREVAEGNADAMPPRISARSMMELATAATKYSDLSRIALMMDTLEGGTPGQIDLQKLIQILPKPFHSLILDELERIRSGRKAGGPVDQPAMLIEGK